MSKENWLRAYEEVYDEHCNDMTEGEMAKLADERAASIEARLADEAMDRWDWMTDEERDRAVPGWRKLYPEEKSNG